MMLITKTHYYDEDMVKKERRYHVDEDDRLQGDYEVYFKDGTLALYAQYKNGKIHGVLKDFNEDGSLKSIQYYWEGKQVSEEEFNKLV